MVLNLPEEVPNFILENADCERGYGFHINCPLHCLFESTFPFQHIPHSAY